MIKYVTSMVTFEEIPTEVTLSLSISNCQNRCSGCHSAELRRNIGTELTDEELERLIRENSGVGCVLLLGEGNDGPRLIELARGIKKHGLKAALYSGRDNVENELWNEFDYIKIGKWIQALGPLNKHSTNQRLYQVERNKCIDITERFWHRTSSNEIAE